MALPNYTLTVSQPGYMPTTAYELEDTCVYDAVDALIDELWYTSEAHDLGFNDSIPSWESTLKQIRDYGSAVIRFGGYVHELTRTED